MAIIKGVRAADVSEVTPYQEDWDKVGAGILAKEQRANEARNMINDSRAAMLKETRDHTEDMQKAQELEQGFKTDVDNMINQAGMDYSQVSKDSLQRLAMDYAGKTDFRVLTEAKRNADEAVKQRQGIESKGGVPVKFGPADPTKDSAWKNDGTINHFTNNWSYEEALDHSQAAKKLYDGIGWQLKDIEKYIDPTTVEQIGTRTLSDGRTVPDWFAYMQHVKDSHKDNDMQVKSVIQGALDGFMRGPEGNQYYRIHRENALYNMKMTPEQADKYARNKVQELITTYGESERIWEDTHLEKRDVVAHARDEAIIPRGPGKSGSDGGGDDKPEPVPAATLTTDNVSTHGIKAGDPKSVINIISENTSKDVILPNVATVTKQSNGAIDNITNPNVLVSSALMVENPNHDPNSNIPQASGYISNLYLGKDVKKNPSAVHFNAHSGPGINNTTANNYKNLTTENGEVYVMEYNQIEKKEIPRGYSAEELKDKLGDDLFHNDDLNMAIDGTSYKDSDGNVVQIKGLKASDPNTKWVTENGKNVNKSLSSYSVDPNTGAVTISPMLYQLEKIYQAKLTNAENPQSRILYQAKLDRVKEKIQLASSFQAENAAGFNKLTNQVNLVNEQNVIMKDNVLALGRTYGIEDNITKSLTGENVAGKDNYIKKVEKAKDNTYNKIGLFLPYMSNISNDTDISGNKYQPLNIKGKLYNVDEVKAINLKLLNAWKTDRENIRSGEYNNLDIPVTKYWSQTSTEFKNTISNDPQVRDYLIATGYFDKLADGYKEILHDVQIDETSGKVTIPNSDIFENTFNQNLQNELKSKSPQIGEFVKSIESMNDVFNRSGVVLYNASSMNTDKTGGAEGTWENKAWIRQRGSSSSPTTEWRNAKWDGKTESEAFDYQSFKDTLEEVYNAERSAGTVTSDSYEKYEAEVLDNAFKGIRMDLDNPGTLFVAHYQLPNGKTMEHDIQLPRSQAVKYFNVPILNYSIGDEIKKGLADNNNMWADIDGFGGDGGIRVHQHLFDKPIDDGSGGKIEKGQFFVLYDKVFGDNPEQDPKIGSDKYHVNDSAVKRKAFGSIEDFYSFVRDKNKGPILVIEKLNGELRNLTNYPTAELSAFYPPNHPFITGNYTRQQVMDEINAQIESASKGGFKPASSLSEYTATGKVVEKVDSDGNKTYNVPADVYKTMSNDDKKNVAFAAKPLLKNKTWYKDESGEDYPVDPTKLTKVEPSKFKHVNLNNVKTSFDNSIADFVSELDLLIANRSINKYPVQSNKDNYNILQPDKPIYITSGLRSLQDNLDAYNISGNGNIADLTDSDHTRGQAIDVRTEPGNDNWEGGKALWEFLKTPDGSSFLKKHGLSAYYHKVKGGGMHIDIAVREPAGKVWEDGNTYQTGK